MGDVERHFFDAVGGGVGLVFVVAHKRERNFGGIDLLVAEDRSLDSLEGLDASKLGFGAGVFRVLHRCECRFDAIADFRRFHIADDYKGHAVGCVVARVEVGESLARGLADDFFFADWEPPCDERIGQHFGKLLLHDAVADRIAAHFFRKDHAAFLVDFRRVEQRAIAEVAHDGEGELHRLLRHVGQVEHVHGFIE